MKTKAVFLLALIGASCCFAEDDGFELKYEPANVKYAIYGFGLGDPIKPTVKDSKITFLVTGNAAKNMFDLMPPDRKDGCVGEGSRLRFKDNANLVCTKDKDGYSCYFGFDLKTGKSIGGNTC